MKRIKLFVAMLFGMSLLGCDAPFKVYVDVSGYCQPLPASCNPPSPMIEPIEFSLKNTKSITVTFQDRLSFDPKESFSGKLIQGGIEIAVEVFVDNKEPMIYVVLPTDRANISVGKLTLELTYKVNYGKDSQVVPVRPIEITVVP